jgi:hypothetical protein
MRADPALSMLAFALVILFRKGNAEVAAGIAVAIGTVDAFDEFTHVETLADLAPADHLVDQPQGV